MKHRSLVSIIGVAALALSVAACGGGDNGGNGAEADSEIQGRIEVIVPWAAGGGSDQATRQLLIAAEPLCDTTFIVSNRTGAAGATGHEAGAAASPDGKTLMDMTAEITLLPHLGNTEVSIADFTPVMRFASISPAFVVPADSPLETIDDLIAAMQAGDTVRVGTTGRGGIWDVAAGGFEQAIGANFTERVPYDGGASIIQAVLGGHLEVGVLAAPEVQAQAESGELRVLAIADDERTAILPDVPTLKESGIDWATRTWFGIAGPAGLPEGQVAALEACLTEAWNTEDYQTFLTNQGYNAAWMNAADFGEFVEAEDAAFAELLPTIYDN